MIYELAILVETELGDEGCKSLEELVHSVVKEHKGEILIQDDWGTRLLAQPTSKGVERGRYLYFIFRACGNNNEELARRFGIHEQVMKYLFIRLGDDQMQEQIAKKYKTPYSKKYAGTVVEEEEGGADSGKDRRNFSKKKHCWFIARNIKADWKDPATYSWLINEFGKISPARVSGVSKKHQRFATTAVKRARQVGLVSHLTNRFAE